MQRARLASRHEICVTPCCRAKSCHFRDVRPTSVEPRFEGAGERGFRSALPFARRQVVNPVAFRDVDRDAVGGDTRDSASPPDERCAGWIGVITNNRSRVCACRDWRRASRFFIGNRLSTE
jgi:hypothetical protein